jgi:hypothetical protein
LRQFIVNVERHEIVHHEKARATPPPKANLAIVGPNTELQVAVKNPETTHRVTLNQIHRWCDGVAVSPNEVLKRHRQDAHRLIVFPFT